MDAPAWLAPHLAPGESVRWTHEPGPEAWRRVVVRLAVGAWLTIWVGASAPSWWTFLPIWPRQAVPPAAAAVLVGLGIVGDVASTLRRQRYTAYAATDRRFLRVPLPHPLSGLLREKADAWPIERVRIVEREARRGKTRLRIEARNAVGKRVARFRVAVPDARALDAALNPSAALPATRP